MDEYTTTRATGYLPQVIVATFVVAVAPVAVAWWLRAGGVISSPWACVAVAITLSLAVSVAGSAYWKRRPKSADVLFSELLIWGWLRRYRLERQLANAAQLLGFSAGSEGALGNADSAEYNEQLLKQLGSALEAQDPYLEGHSRRVARHAAGVSRKLGLADEEVTRVRAAAAVHDVGKLRVPAALLRKPEPLTDDEFEAVMRHAVAGAEMVTCMGDPELTAIVRHHHERYDGLGYPDGLGGDAIPLGARIVAVADTFDAITSVRPYRAAARHKQAIDVLVGQAGTQLDPAVVRAFVRYYSGRKASVLWVILAVSPQRALAWLRGRAGEPAAAPVGELAASAVGRVVICAAAAGTTVGVGVAAHESPIFNRQAPIQIAAAAAPFALQAGGQPTSHASAANATKQAAAALGSLTQLTTGAVFKGLQVSAAGGAPTLPGRGHAGANGLGSAGAGPGGWSLTTGSSAGRGGSGAGRSGTSGSGTSGSGAGSGRSGGSGGGSGMRTGATPTGSSKRHSGGGNPSSPKRQTPGVPAASGTAPVSSPGPSAPAPAATAAPAPALAPAPPTAAASGPASTPTPTSTGGSKPPAGGGASGGGGGTTTPGGTAGGGSAGGGSAGGGSAGGGGGGGTAGGGGGGNQTGGGGDGHGHGSGGGEGHGHAYGHGFNDAPASYSRDASQA